VGLNPDAEFLDPEFDCALVGITRRFGIEPIATYSCDRIIDVLMGQGLTFPEANRQLDITIMSTCCEEHDPVFVEMYR